MHLNDMQLEEATKEILRRAEPELRRLAGLEALKQFEGWLSAEQAIIDSFKEPLADAETNLAAMLPNTRESVALEWYVKGIRVALSKFQAQVDDGRAEMKRARLEAAQLATRGDVPKQ
jgi:hypothetical protein